MAKYRIGLNIVAATESSTSSKSFPKNLLRGLASIDTEHSYCVFVNDRVQGEFRVEKDNFRTIPLRVPDKNAIIRALWEQLLFPRILDRYGLDLLHCPIGNVVPVFWRGRTVCTVHDLIVLKFPSCYPKSKHLYLRCLLPKSVRKSQHIITDSESSKADIIDRFGLPQNRISVIYHTLSEEIFHNRKSVDASGSRDRLRRQYGIGARFVLAVGTLEPIKNYETLIRAFSLLRTESMFPDLSLVIVGPKGWHSEDTFALVREAGLEERVVLTGYVSDEVLSELYCLAELFVTVSLYEGFGLPVLEALYHGLPVIVSDRSSLPEIVGSSGILVNPTDTEEIAKKILGALKDDRNRQSLETQARERAREFVGNRMAEQTFDVYRRVLGDRD